MQNAFSRTELLLGTEAMAVLARSRVAVFGLGGVGSWAAEALARSGVGAFVLVDDDRVSLSNLNRQLVALRSTLGKPKVEVMRDRILDINPDAELRIFRETYNADTAGRILTADVDYVVDAIDMVSSKIDLVMRCKAMGIPIISAMGTGNKLDPTRLELADIHKTAVCPLARVMRQELRKRRVKRLEVVYSREVPARINAAVSNNDSSSNGDATVSHADPQAADVPDPVYTVSPAEAGLRAGRRSIPASVSFVPSAAGLIIAARVVAVLTGKSG